MPDNTNNADDNTEDAKAAKAKADADARAKADANATSTNATSTNATSTTSSPLTPAAPKLAPTNTVLTPEGGSARPELTIEELYRKQQENEAKLSANEEKSLQNIDESDEKKAAIERETEEKKAEIDLKKGKLVAPQLQQVPYKPATQTSPAEQWGSMVMIFAMLGSLFTRRHATTALNAAAAAMNGFNQKNDAASKQALEEFKVANANMLKAAEFQQKAYEDALKGYDTEEKLAEIAGTKKEKEIDANVKAVNSALQHTNLEIIREQNGLQGVLRALDLEKKNAASIAEMTARTEKLQREAKQKDDIKVLLDSQEYRGASPQERAAMIDKINGDTKHSDALAKADAQLKRGGKITPDEVDSIAEAMASFNYPIPTSSKMSSDPNLRAALLKAQQLHPNLIADGIARQKDLLDIESLQTSKAIKALDVADNHIQSFLKALANKPTVGDAAVFDSWASSLSRAVNGPAQAKYGVVADIVATEVTKAVQGTGASGALSDRDTMRKIFSNALNGEAGEAVAEELQDLLNGQRLGIAQAKGRFFTPEQIFGNKKGAAVRKYAEENGGLDTFPSNAQQLPGKTMDQLRAIIDPDRKPVSDGANAYLDYVRKNHPEYKDTSDDALIKYYEENKDKLEEEMAKINAQSGVK
jgi:hypothetical protein